MEGITISSADAETARQVSHWMPPKCKTPHSIIPMITEYYNRVSFGMQIAKTATYPVMCRFPLFDTLVIKIHQPYRRSDFVLIQHVALTLTGTRTALLPMFYAVLSLKTSTYVYLWSVTIQKSTTNLASSYTTLYLKSHNLCFLFNLQHASHDATYWLGYSSSREQIHYKPEEECMTTILNSSVTSPLKNRKLPQHPVMCQYCNTKWKTRLQNDFNNYY